MVRGMALWNVFGAHRELMLISIPAKFKLSRIELVSVAEQDGLNLTTESQTS